MEELETAPEAGVRGITVARDRGGLYVAQAPKSLHVRPGDRLLSARFYFEGAPPEEVGRVLEGARSCKVSFCLRRPPRGPPPGTEGRWGKVARLRIPLPTRSKKPPPAPTAAKTPLPGAAAAAAAALELALPKPGKNRGSAQPVAPVATTAEPGRPRPRLRVKEAAAGKTPPGAMEEEPPVKREAAGGGGITGGGRLPAVEVTAPKINLGLSLEGPAEFPEEDEEGERGRRRLPALRLPSIPVAAPGAAVELGVPKPEPPLPPAIDVAAPPLEVGLALPTGTGEEEEEDDEDDAAGGIPEAAAKFAKGLGKLSLELEPPPEVEIAPPAGLTATPKLPPPKLALPRLGLAIAKLRGGDERRGPPPAAPPTRCGPSWPPALAVSSPPVALDLVLGAGGGTKLKVPKLSLVAPFGPKGGDEGGEEEEEEEEEKGGGGCPGMKLPWLGMGGGGPGGGGRKRGPPGPPGSGCRGWASGPPCPNSPPRPSPTEG